MQFGEIIVTDQHSHINIPTFTSPNTCVLDQDGNDDNDSQEMISKSTNKGNQHDDENDDPNKTLLGGDVESNASASPNKSNVGNSKIRLDAAHYHSTDDHLAAASSGRQRVRRTKRRGATTTAASSMSSSSSCLSKLKSVSRHGIGIFLIILVAFIWVSSSEFLQYVFGNENFDKPYFVTYFNTMSFALWMVGFACPGASGFGVNPWSRRDGGDVTPLSSSAVDDAEHDHHRSTSVVHAANHNNNNNHNHNHQHDDDQHKKTESSLSTSSKTKSSTTRRTVAGSIGPVTPPTMKTEMRRSTRLGAADEGDEATVHPPPAPPPFGTQTNQQNNSRNNNNNNNNNDNDNDDSAAVINGSNSSSSSSSSSSTASCTTNSKQHVAPENNRNTTKSQRSQRQGEASTSEILEQPQQEEEDEEEAAVSVVQPYTIREIAYAAFLFCPLWFVANVLFNYSLSRTSVASNTILSSTSCIWAMIFSRLLLKEPVTVQKLLAIGLSFGGAFMVGFGDQQEKSNDSATNSNNSNSSTSMLEGNVLAGVSAMFYAAYTTVLRHCLPDERRYPIGLCFAFVGVFNALLLWPGLILLNYLGVETFVWPSAKVAGFLILNGLVGTNLSDILWAKSVILTSPVIATLGLSLTIPVAMLADLVLRGQWHSALYLAGAVLVTLGFVVANWQVVGESNKEWRRKECCGMRLFGADISSSSSDDENDAAEGER